MLLNSILKNNFMSTSKDKTVVLLAFGFLLAIFKIVYFFFDFYNILDFIVFLTAGFLLGGKVPPNRWALGLLLSLPAFTLCLLIVIKLGYTSIVNGIGIAYLVSLIVIPVATSIGIFINAKRTLRRNTAQK